MLPSIYRLNAQLCADIAIYRLFSGPVYDRFNSQIDKLLNNPD
jgi:hypothetical protein